MLDPGSCWSNSSSSVRHWDLHAAGAAEAAGSMQTTMSVCNIVSYTYACMQAQGVKDEAPIKETAPTNEKAANKEKAATKGKMPIRGKLATKDKASIKNKVPTKAKAPDEQVKTHAVLAFCCPVL